MILLGIEGKREEHRTRHRVKPPPLSLKRSVSQPPSRMSMYVRACITNEPSRMRCTFLMTGIHMDAIYSVLRSLT